MAAGGCDSWNCLHSVERYDMTLKKWVMMPPMNTTRRGSGAVMFKGKLSDMYVFIKSSCASPLFSLFIFLLFMNPEMHLFFPSQSLPSGQ